MVNMQFRTLNEIQSHLTTYMDQSVRVVS